MLDMLPVGLRRFQQNIQRVFRQAGNNINQSIKKRYESTFSPHLFTKSVQRNSLVTFEQSEAPLEAYDQCKQTYISIVEQFSFVQVKGTSGTSPIYRVKIAIYIGTRYCFVLAECPSFDISFHVKEVFGKTLMRHTY